MNKVASPAGIRRGSGFSAVAAVPRATDRGADTHHVSSSRSTISGWALDDPYLPGDDRAWRHESHAKGMRPVNPSVPAESQSIARA